MRSTTLYSFSNALVAAPMYPLPYRVLINIYSQDKQFEKLYRVADRMFQAYTQNPGAFEARIPKNELKNYFNYLYQVESANHNDAKANAIAPYIK